jgi:LexA-binding, inner membrane-associated putative hydrolase
MPQTGLHAALALATRKTFSKQRWFALGLTFGALTPDADSYPQAFAIILGKMDPLKAQEIFHRTLAHSLLFALAVGVGFYIVSLASGAPSLRKFGLGMATGIAALHIFVDIFAWFDAVGILWPLWSLNLWSWFTTPEVMKNIIRSGNFLAFAGYFAYLAVIARRANTNTSYLSRLRLYTYAQVGLGVVFLVLAFFLSAKAYNLPDGTAYLFLAYPNALWVTWRMRETIEAA